MNKGIPDLVSGYDNWEAVGQIVVILIMVAGPFLFIWWAQGQNWYTGYERNIFIQVAVLWIPAGAIGWVVHHLVIYTGVRLTLPELQKLIVSETTDNTAPMIWGDTTEFETFDDENLVRIMRRYIRLRRRTHTIIFYPILAASVLGIIWVIWIRR